MFLPPPTSGMFWGAGVWGAWVWGGAAQLLIPGTPIVYSHFSWKKSPRPWKRKVKQFPHRKSSLGGLVIPGKPVGVYMPVPGPSSSGLAGTTQLFSLQQAPPELYVIGVGQPMLYDLPAEKNLYLPPAQLTLAQLTFPLDLRFVNEGAIAIIDLGSVSDIVILYLDLGLA